MLKFLFVMTYVITFTPMKKDVIQIRIDEKKKKEFKKYAHKNKKKVSEIIESDIDKHLSEK